MIQAIASDRTAEWFAARNKGVGASEAAAVCGLSKWETPLDVWARKTGRTSGTVATPVMELGTFLEPALMDRVHQEHPIKHRAPGLFQHGEASCVLATPDGILEDSRGLELKITSDANDELSDDPDGLPASWLFQAQQQIAVCNFPSVMFAVVVLPSGVREWLLDNLGSVGAARSIADGLAKGTIPVRYWTIERHSKMIDGIINRDVEFWTHVETDTPPEIDWNHSRACQAVRSAFEHARDGEIKQLAESDLAVWQAYRHFCDIESEAKKYKDQLHADLFACIGDSHGGEFPNGEVIRKVSVSGGPVSYQRKSYSHLRAAAKPKGKK